MLLNIKLAFSYISYLDKLLPISSTNGSMSFGLKDNDNLRMYKVVVAAIT